MNFDHFFYMHWYWQNLCKDHYKLFFCLFSELRPLIDVKILFPLNMLRTNWWILMWCCVCIKSLIHLYHTSCQNNKNNYDGLVSCNACSTFIYNTVAQFCIFMPSCVKKILNTWANIKGSGRSVHVGSLTGPIWPTWWLRIGIWDIAWQNQQNDVRPAKTQISLGLCPVWSESSLSAWRNLGSIATHWVHSKDSDQTGFVMLWLIWRITYSTTPRFLLSWVDSFINVYTTQYLYFLLQVFLQECYKAHHLAHLHPWALEGLLDWALPPDYWAMHHLDSCQWVHHPLGLDRQVGLEVKSEFGLEIIWAVSSEFGTYHLCEQRRFRRACASAQSRQNLRCSLIQAVSHEEPSDRKPDP